jgi:hypothetical protein
MSRNQDDLTATKLRDRPIEEDDTVVDAQPPEQDIENSPLDGPYGYYESSPDRDDEETRNLVRSALKLLLGRSKSKK